MGDVEGFPERMRFELYIKRWVLTGQEKQEEWIFKEERAEYKKAEA